MALTFYRDALAGGVKPDGKLLNFLFSCMRLPLKKEEEGLPRPFQSGQQYYNEPLTFGLAKEGIIYMPMPQDPMLMWRFDLRVNALIQEAISIGALPHFQLSGACFLDLRSMWPVVAEVYVMTVFNSLFQKIQNAVRKANQTSIIIQVQPFDHSKVLQTSHTSHHDRYPEDDANANIQEQQPYMRFVKKLSQTHVSRKLNQEFAFKLKQQEQEEYFDEEPKWKLVGLGICGQLRRMGIRPKISGEQGLIEITSKEITRWSRWWNRKTLQESNTSFGNVSHFQNLLQDQQRTIRSDMHNKRRPERW
eukprot:TRINITY_DN16169_c0_g1_i2.p1 TRINITY_DN16169_c0_g1~~TRINITY_DN16169_c0_g1_i2.p1  ORF type:complete len:305 (-),score=44.57 TRINITY_DN16169_c0_g1_i2:537-1451(-)